MKRIVDAMPAPGCRLHALCLACLSLALSVAKALKDLSSSVTLQQEIDDRALKEQFGAENLLAVTLGRDDEDPIRGESLSLQRVLVAAQRNSAWPA